MNRFSKIALTFLFSMFATLGFSKNTGDLSKPTPKSNDSVITTKSNIVIFKMIPAPALNTPSNGSLKKAGKVARTSNSYTN